MKLKELIKICCEMLFLDVPSEIFVDSSFPQDAIANRLVGCYKLVQDELFCDYATAIRKTVVECRDGVIDITPYKLCKVISLVDGEGNDIPFRYSDGALYAEKNGKFNLCYARLPDETDWDGEVITPSPRITARTVAYGVVREYLTQTNDWAAAKQWDMRFKDALQVAHSKAVTNLPARGWL